jgi:sRNA-binding carbon storage regulator CsrA
MKRLTCHVGESFRIGPSIRVKLISSTGTRLRIGIWAPRNVPINRPETENRPAPTGDETIGLLTLTRHIGDGLLIGTDIAIKFLRHVGSAVEFSIEAPVEESLLQEGWLK